MFKKLVRIVINLVIAAPFMSGMLIDKQNNPYLYVVVFRNILPTTIGNFYLFGLCNWISLKLGLINTRQPTEEDDFYRVVMAKKIDTDKK